LLCTSRSHDHCGQHDGQSTNMSPVLKAVHTEPATLSKFHLQNLYQSFRTGKKMD
jgi:hypothetical protein